LLRKIHGNNGIFDIPKIRKQEIDINDIQLGNFKNIKRLSNNKIIHMYLDDDIIEPI
jgi:hypothetical protein